MAPGVDESAIRQRFEALAPVLDERGRRRFAAAEAITAGRGGVAAVARATGLARSTIGRALAELRGSEAVDTQRIRRPDGGRRPRVATDAGLIEDLRALVEPATRGDPQSPLLWTAAAIMGARRLQGPGSGDARSLRRFPALGVDDHSPRR